MIEAIKANEWLGDFNETRTKRIENTEKRQKYHRAC
jgi:hypothetical protein